MKPREILVFGGSGQLGRHLLRKLTRLNFKVTVVTRNVHKKGYILKSQANAGWIDIIEISSFNYQKLDKLFKNKDICINLIGILNQKNKNSFYNIHTLLPQKLAELSKKNNIKQFIHLSALGIEEATESKYALSKLNGEQEIKKILNNYVILKPSIVYSVDDKFSTMLMTILKYSPLFPIYFNGKTIFHPIHVTDMCEIIEKAILNELKGQTIECIGPEKITFKQILNRLSNLLKIKRFLIPTPLFFAKILASFFEVTMKNPLLTKDQLVLLNYNNSPSGKYKTNLQLLMNTDPKYFDKEISKYCHMWRDGGEFSKENS